MLPLFDRFFRKQTVLEGILVFFGRARSRGAAMHPATFFAVHRRRLAGAAFPGFGATALAGQHWTGVA